MRKHSLAYSDCEGYGLYRYKCVITGTLVYLSLERLVCKLLVIDLRSKKINLPILVVFKFK